jgi:hypothetical protein
MKTRSRILLTLFGAIIASAMLVLPTLSSQAQYRKCGNRATMIKVLIEKYNETPRALGLSSANKVAMEIYASEKGSWTVMMTMTNGTTCIMAAGHSWQEGPKVDNDPRT